MKRHILFIALMSLLLSLFGVQAATIDTLSIGDTISGYDDLIVNDKAQYRFVPRAGTNETWQSCTLMTDRSGSYTNVGTLDDVSDNTVNKINVTGMVNLKDKFNWKVSCDYEYDNGTSNITKTAEASSTAYIFTKSRLMITNIVFDYEEQRRDSTENEDQEFDFDDMFTKNIEIDRVAQNSEVEVEVEIVNLWQDRYDDYETEIRPYLEIESDDTRDIDDEDTDFKDIDAEDEEDASVTLKIPIDLLEDDDRDTFDFTILVEGEDGNRTDHEDEIAFTLEIEKPDEWLYVSDMSFSRDTVSCVRESNLRVKFSNAGQDELDEVMLHAYSDGLDFEYVERDIELDDDITDYEIRTIPIEIDEDQASGSYKVYVKFYDDNDEDDLLSGGIALGTLDVEKCQEPVQEEEEDETQEEDTTSDGEDASQDGTTSVPDSYQPIQTQPVKTTTSGSISQDYLMIGLLATLNVALLLVGVFLIVKYIKK